MQRKRACVGGSLRQEARVQKAICSALARIDKRRQAQGRFPSASLCQVPTFAFPSRWDPPSMHIRCPRTTLGSRSALPNPAVRAIFLHTIWCCSPPLPLLTTTLQRASGRR